MLLCLAVIGVSTVVTVNVYVKSVGGDAICTPEEAVALENVDCIIVLGCQVKDDGTPSDMLRDRLIRAVKLYDLGAASKIIMSGDHGTEVYNEVAVMIGAQ